MAIAFVYIRPYHPPTSRLSGQLLPHKMGSEKSKRRKKKRGQGGESKIVESEADNNK